jgi:hypothetical protein
MALAGIIDNICGDMREFFLGWDLAEQIRHDRGIANPAPGNLNRPNLKRFLIDSEVNLASDAPFGTAMLARIPLAFTLYFNTGAIDRKVLRPVGVPIRDVHGQRFMAA